MYQDDWIMREITMLSNFIARYLFKKDIRKMFEEIEDYSGNSLNLYNKAVEYLDNEDINGFLEFIDSPEFNNDLELLLILLNRVNELEDEAFIKNGVEREDISKVVKTKFSKYLPESLEER